MAGMFLDQSLRISHIGICLSMMMTCVSWFIMATLDRRFIILAMGIGGLFPTNTKALRFINICLTLLVNFTNGLSVGSAYPIVISKVSSIRLHPCSSGVGFISNALSSWLFNFTVPYMFNADEKPRRQNRLRFCNFSIIGFVGSWLFVPETKTTTFAEIDYLFQRKTPTRAFKKAIPEILRQKKGGEAQSPLPASGNKAEFCS